MQYGTDWLIYKFNITKAYFEKFIENGSTQNSHRFIYDRSNSKKISNALRECINALFDKKQ